MYRTLTLGVFVGLLLSPPVAAQQNPNGVIPVHTSNQPYLFLVRDPVVHAAAKLTETQKSKLTKLNNRLDLPLWSMRNKKPQDIAKIMTGVLEETNSALSQFLEAEQIERFQQAEYWVLGVKSLLRDNVAAHLELSSDQQSKVRQIIVDAEKQLAGFQQELQNGGNADELNQKWGETKHQQRKDALAVLSDDQRQNFRAMLGDQIQVAKLGRIKMKVPDFVNGSKWVNSEPLTMEKLKGKVVALHFYAFA